MLKLRACDAMTIGIGAFAGWSDEFSGGKGLGRQPLASTGRSRRQCFSILSRAIGAFAGAFWPCHGKSVSACGARTDSEL